MTDQPLNAGLYMIATPIGNLGDITLRSIQYLQRCDVVACEDSRVTGKLLKHLGISKPMVRYDDHAGDAVRDRLVARMAQEAVVLASDAGTPLISDPGFQLVRAARAAHVPVSALPGPCAAIAALTMSGLASDRFVFAGFLPGKEKARGDALDALKGQGETSIFYESPARLTKTLAAVAQRYPARQVSVARELTKLHEECRTGTAGELLAHYEAKPPRGEIVLMIGPAELEGPGNFDTDALLRAALAENKPSHAAKQVAAFTGLDRKDLYARALELRSE